MLLYLIIYLLQEAKDVLINNLFVPNPFLYILVAIEGTFGVEAGAQD